MKDYLIKEDVFMALTGDITDCTIEEFIARLRDKLSKLPSVTPKEKTGRWIDNTDCSCCGWAMYDDVTESKYYVGFKYCPNCGTKMIESQESEKI